VKKNHRNLIASLQSFDSTFTDLLQEFPEDLIKSARQFEAFRRGRKIKNVEQLFQIVLLYCGLDYSLRETAGALTLLGTTVSDQAVSDRLSGCALWLRYLLKEMLPKLPAAAAQTGGRWIVIDGSSVQVPGACSTSYRIHLAWDWARQTILEWIITDVTTGESLTLYQIEEADLIIADRGYAKAKDLKYVLDKGGAVLVRVAPYILPMLDEDGKAFNVADELWAANGNQVSQQVWLKADAEKRKMFLHSFRLPPEKAAQARRKKRAKARKNGVKLKKETLEYAEWVIIISSVPPERISAAEIAEIYRLRWQIEIVIKRLKSVLEIDGLRGRLGSRISEVYLLGKSLYALLISRRSGQLKEAKQVEWRVWKMVKQELEVCISQVKRWKKENIKQAIKQMKERKRKRKSQLEQGRELITRLLSTA
jgi:hypothetical protein